MLRHIYVDSAYRSELDLFKNAKVSAIEAEQIEVPADTKSVFRIETNSGTRFTACPTSAWNVFKNEGGDYLRTILDEQS